MSHELADLIAKRYIARQDVKAIQHKDGSWSPHTKSGKRDGERLPWTRNDLNNHLTGDMTFGHYLLSQNSDTKLFAFDVDLEKAGPGKGPFFYPEGYGEDPLDEPGPSYQPIEFNPREAWKTRSHPSRSWLKYQMKLIAHELLNGITKELDIPCAAAYSGGKGVHVYGYTGLMNADEVRSGAQIVLDLLGHYEPTRGSNFFKDTNTDLFTGFQNFCIEVFPKQSHIDEDGLGNLMRLPLGCNLKSADPTFFIDMTSPLGVMTSVDPMHALAGNPWKMAGE